MPPARHFLRPESRTLIESRIRTSGCTGALPSAPLPPPTWLCVSTSPGRITFPVRSIRCASEGIGVLAAGPTAAIVPPETITTPPGIGGPEIGIRSAPTKAVSRSWAAAWPARRTASSTSSLQAILRRALTRLVRRPGPWPAPPLRPAGGRQSPRPRWLFACARPPGRPGQPWRRAWLPRWPAV